MVEQPCIVIGRKGSVGAVYLLNGPSWPIDTTYFVIPPAEIELKYLYYLLGSRGLAQLDKSTTIPGLNREDLYRTVIPLAPQSEQTRIVEKLEELFSDLDAGVAELKAAQKKLAQYRQALLKAAVEGALTAEWRTRRAAQGLPIETGAQLLTRILAERRRRWEEKQLAKFAEQGKTPPQDWQDKYPTPVQPDTSELPELPEGWTWVSIDQLIKEPIVNGISVKGTDQPIGVAALRLNAMTEQGFDYSARRYLPLEAEKVDDLWIKTGDFFVSRGNGSKHLVGRGTLAQEPPGLIIFPDTMMRLRLMNELLELAWIPTIWSSQLVRHQIERRAKTTAGIWKIAQPDLVGVIVPLPSREEQIIIAQMIENQFSAILNLQADIEAKLKGAQTLRQVILRQAFSGQLVAQDPNDEPASVLLERIRAERAERAQQPKPRKAKVSKQEVQILMKKLVDVLAEAADWITAEEAFRRCGVTDGTSTERIEELYAELRELVKAEPTRVEVEREENSDKLKLTAHVA
jgi:type I restriction enzyme, S subunit